MFNLLIAILIIVLLVFAMVLMYLLRLTKKMQFLESQLDNLVLVVDSEQIKSADQHQLIESLKKANQNTFLENEQVTKQLDARTKNIQTKISDIENAIKRVKSEQPEDRLYRRALKMVELGADIEEVMSECELPRAEAELLFSIHLKLND